MRVQVNDEVVLEVEVIGTAGDDGALVVRVNDTVVGFEAAYVREFRVGRSLTPEGLEALLVDAVETARLVLVD
jgi:hypothetical protein